MPLIAKTLRLTIRTFNVGEEGAYLDLFSDERVTEHLPLRTRDENCQIFQDTLAADARGAVFSKWAITNNDDTNFIGMGLLRPYNNEADKLELGYCLHVKYWGTGLATELCLALIAYAAKYPQIKILVAVTTPANKASQIVLEKAGFINQGRIVRNNEELVFYKRSI